MISIITSAYNSGKTIKKTIESVLFQTYNDFEFIIINDYSTDNTEDIIKSYDDNRIKYIKNKINLGCGKTRQVGIDNISENSEYMCFLDSDDYIKEDYLETLYNKAVKDNIDFITSGNILIKNETEHVVAPSRERIVEGEYRYTYDSDVSKLLTGAFIRSSLWKKVRYSDERFMEDVITNIKLIYYSKRRLFTDYCGYYYTQNDWSLTHTLSLFKRSVYGMTCIVEAIKFFESTEIDNTPLKAQLKDIISRMNNLEVKEKEFEEFGDRLNSILEFSDNL